MKLGVCCSVDRAELALSLGADYVELAASGLNGFEDSWDPAPFQGLPVEATNLFFPSEIKLFGSERTDPPVLSSYVSRTLERAATLGVRLMVIGSGASRRCPAPGLPVSEANLEFVRFVGSVQSEARQYGIVIAPESLNRTETNVGNDLAWLAGALAEAGAGFTADSFHVLYEWDAGMREGDPGASAPSQGYLARQVPVVPLHVHFGDLPRSYPRADDPMARAFCARLKALGYDGRVSLECAWDDFERELPVALDSARKLLRVE